MRCTCHDPIGANPRKCGAPRRSLPWPVQVDWPSQVTGGESPGPGMMQVMRSFPAALVLALSAGACVADAVDLTERECPCISGWVCDVAMNRCVPAADGRVTPMDGGVEPPMDTGVRRDAGGTDAGGTDAGPPDSGPPDAGPPASNCETVFSGRLFCDGFESGDTSRWDGEQTGGAGSITVVDDPVYMGDSALRVQGNPGSGRTYAWKAVFPTSGSTDQWLRGYYYFPGSNGFGAEVNAMSDTDHTYDVVVAVNRSSTNFHTHSWPTDTRADWDMGIAEDTWRCIELHVHLDATEGAFELFVDDVLVAEAMDRVNTVPRGLSNILAGFGWKDSASTNVVYVDEVVADDERIGCD